ncbi:MAG: OmpH family outer membrane protein [Enterobacteriaceae bacterium]
MKRYFILFLFILNFTSYTTNNSKIAVINLYKIFIKLSEKEQTTKKLEYEFKDRLKELQLIENDINIKILHLQKNKINMNKNEILSLENDIIKNKKIFSNKLNLFEEDNNKRQIEEKDKILKKIKNKIVDIAFKNNYELIFDSNSVLYSSEKIKDLTLDVINSF